MTLACGTAAGRLRVSARAGVVALLALPCCSPVTEPVQPAAPPEREPYALQPVGPGNRFDWNAGTLEAGEMLRKRFVFHNATAEDVRIAETMASCTCTHAELTREVLAPGEVGELEIGVDTTGLHDDFLVDVSLLDDAPESRVLARFRLFGLVGRTSALFVDPGRLELELPYGAEAGGAEIELVASQLGEGTPRFELSQVTSSYPAELSGPSSVRLEVQGKRNLRRATYRLELFELPGGEDGSTIVEIFGMVNGVPQTAKLGVEVVRQGARFATRSLYLGKVSPGVALERRVALRAQPGAAIELRPSRGWIVAAVERGAAASDILALEVTPPAGAGFFTEWIEIVGGGRLEITGEVR